MTRMEDFRYMYSFKCVRTRGPFSVQGNVPLLSVLVLRYRCHAVRAFFAIRFKRHATSVVAFGLPYVGRRFTEECGDGFRLVAKRSTVRGFFCHRSPSQYCPTRLAWLRLYEVV